MSDSSDTGDRTKRIHERFGVDWRVALKCRDWKFVSRVAALNASRGGLFLSTSRPPQLGTQVELTVELPDQVKVRLRGTVVHVVTPAQALASGRSPGIGVKLDERHQTDLMLLEKRAATSGQFAALKPEPAAAASDEAGGPDEPAPPDGDRQEAASAGAGETGTEPPDHHDEPEPEPATHVPGDVPATQLAEASGPAPAASPTFHFRRPQGEIAPAVGIDFGTTYSSISVAIGEEVYLIPDEEGRKLHPSIVGFPEKGKTIVGWDARANLVTDPRRTVASAKRLLGRTFGDPTVAGHLHAAAYKTARGPNDAILIDIEGEQLAVPQICASVITHLKNFAERQLDTAIREVTLSVPVTFTERERAALRRAAQLAGLEVIGLIEEPVAGALAYGFGQGKNEIVAVYDFGGGTFDFTVMDVSGDNFRILATEGDSWLGGDDFDLAIAQAVADAFWRATKIELRQRVVEWQRLLLACEEAKRQLSENTVSTITVEDIVLSPRRLNLRQKLERPVFERLCAELFERSLTVCKEALDRAGLEPTDITQLVCTGGVSRIPFVRNGLSRYFEREVTYVVNPDEAICLGAGVRAARLTDHALRTATG